MHKKIIAIHSSYLIKKPANIIIRVIVLPDGLGDAGQAINLARTLQKSNPSLNIQVVFFAVSNQNLEVRTEYGLKDGELIKGNIDHVKALVKNANLDGAGHKLFDIHFQEAKAVKFPFYISYAAKNIDFDHWTKDLPKEQAMYAPSAEIDSPLNKTLKAKINHQFETVLIDAPVPYVTYEKSDPFIKNGFVKPENYILLSEYGSKFIADKWNDYLQSGEFDSLEQNQSFQPRFNYLPLGLAGNLGTTHLRPIGIFINPFEKSMADMKDLSLKEILLSSYIFDKNKIEEYRKNNMLSMIYSRSAATQFNTIKLMAELIALNKPKLSTIDFVFSSDMLLNFKSEFLKQSFRESGITDIELLKKQEDGSFKSEIIHVGPVETNQKVLKLRLILPGRIDREDFQMLIAETAESAKAKNGAGIMIGSGDGSFTDVFSAGYETCKSQRGAIFPILEHRMQFHENTIKNLIDIQKTQIDNLNLHELLIFLGNLNEGKKIQDSHLETEIIKKIARLMSNPQVQEDYRKLCGILYSEQNACTHISHLINELLAFQSFPI